MDEPIVRKRLMFEGRVQGVGFRYRARHAASLTGVTGWVRNDPGGSVTMEVQGTEAMIDRTVQLIGQGRYVLIESVKARSLPPKPGERGFRTLYDEW